MSYNYYEDQLNQFDNAEADNAPEYNIQIKFRNSKKETHWITLNLASLPIAVRFLSRVMEMEIKKEVR